MFIVNLSKSYLRLFVLLCFLIFPIEYNLAQKKEIPKKPLSGMEINLKKAVDNSLIEKIKTDSNGICQFNNISKGKYNLSCSCYNAEGIDILLNEFSLVRKDVRMFIFTLKVLVNGSMVQYEIVEKTPTQVSQKTAGISFSTGLEITDESGSIEVIILLELSVSGKK